MSLFNNPNAKNIQTRLRQSIPGGAAPNSYLLTDPSGVISVPPIVGAQWFVDPQNGSDNFDGKSWLSAFASMSALDDLLQTWDTINLRGVLREQWVAPLGVFNATIRGMESVPRQATSDGVPTGGGATWLCPTSPTATTPLLVLRQQGWTIENIFFNADGADDAACIQLRRQEDATYPDPSHALIQNCRFGGGLYGVQDLGGCFGIQLIGNHFYNFAETGEYGVRCTSTAVALPLMWEVYGNRFYNNVNHFVAALSNGQVEFNNFSIIGFGAITTTIALSLTGGKNNSVMNNMFNRPVNTSPNATLYVGGTSDVWSQNYGSDAIFFGVPDNS